MIDLKYFLQRCGGKEQGLYFLNNKQNFRTHLMVKNYLPSQEYEYIMNKKTFQDKSKV